MKQVSIPVREGSADRTFFFSYEISTSVTVEVLVEDGRSFRADGPDLWNAFLALRKNLESEGIMLCCNGARPDVWPSGMAGQMGDGRSAYKARPGKRPSRDDLVDILAPTPCSEVVTVEEQVRARIARHKPAPRLRRDLPLATPEEALAQAGKIVFDFDDVFRLDEMVDFRHVRGLIPVDKNGVMKDKYWPNESYEGPPGTSA